MDRDLPGGKIDSAQKEQLMEQVKAQIAVANAQELLQKMSDKCFRKCVSKPGSSLDNSEQKCVSLCMDRYMDTWNVVSRVYAQRLQREKGRFSWLRSRIVMSYIGVLYCVDDSSCLSNKAIIIYGSTLCFINWCITSVYHWV